MNRHWFWGKVFIHKPMPMNSGIRVKLFPGEDKKKLSTTRLEAVKLTKLPPHNRIIRETQGKEGEIEHQKP